MIEAGIDDGDLVVVKKQVEANEGDIVAVSYTHLWIFRLYYAKQKWTIV